LQPDFISRHNLVTSLKEKLHAFADFKDASALAVSPDDPSFGKV
jgi:hypothetical protein